MQGMKKGLMANFVIRIVTKKFNRNCIFDRFNNFEMMDSTEQLKPVCYLNWLVFICLSCVIFSCKTGDTLADKGAIQKRRYQNGYHVNIKAPLAFNKSAKRLERPIAEPISASIDSKVDFNRIEPNLKISAIPISKNALSSPRMRLDEEGRKRFKNEHQSEVSLVSKSKSMVVTSDYTHQQFLRGSDPETDYYGSKKLNVLALLSFIFALLSLFIAGIPLGIAALVCGIIGLTQILSSPDSYKGQGFAIAGIIIGLISIVLVIAILAAM